MIIHALVARGTTVLCSHTVPASLDSAVSEAVPDAVPKILSRLNASQNSQQMFAHAGVLFNIIVANRLVYMAVTTGNADRRIAFNFLKEVMVSCAQYRATKTIAAFPPHLASRIEYYNSNPATTARSDFLEAQLKEVREKLVAKIDEVFADHEHIDSLHATTETLDYRDFRFKRSTKKLKRAMWINRIKFWLAIITIMAVATWLAASIACGFDFHKCRKM